MGRGGFRLKYFLYQGKFGGLFEEFDGKGGGGGGGGE